MKPMADEYDLGARIRAARHYAGYRDIPSLARAIRQQGIRKKGLGSTQLRQIERGELEADVGQIRDIAMACGLPLAWFSADFSRLGEISPEDPQEVLQRETARAVRRSRKRRPAASEDNPDPQKADREH